MNFKKSATFLAASVLVVITGCATRPGAVKPVAAPYSAYTGKTCDELSAALAQAKVELKDHSFKQNVRANIDFVTTVVTLVPLSWVSGSSKKDIAKWKGEIVAIESTQGVYGCSSEKVLVTSGGQPPAAASE